MSGGFLCDRCGKCCRTHRVPLTASDMARLERGGHNTDDFVELLSPDQVDMVGEPESFAETQEGRRVIVLSHDRDEEGAKCVFLTPEGCSVHEHRPAACHAYPFDRSDSDRPLGTHPSLVCPEPAGVALTLSKDVQDTETRSWLDAIAGRDREAHHHASLLQRWNARQRTRARMHKPAQPREDLLAYLKRSSD